MWLASTAKTRTERLRVLLLASNSRRCIASMYLIQQSISAGFPKKINACTKVSGETNGSCSVWSKKYGIPVIYLQVYCSHFWSCEIHSMSCDVVIVVG